MEWLDSVLNSVGFTVGVSVLFVCVFALIIFSKTSYGKKKVKFILSGFSRLEQSWGDFQAKHDKIVVETKNRLVEYEKRLDEKIAEFDKRNEELRNLVLLVAENINNVKVKEYLGKYLELTDLDISALKEEYREKAVEEYEKVKEQIASLEEKVKGQIEEVVGVVEDGEQKEE